MSSIIEADAYAHHFQRSEVNLSDAATRFGDLAFIFAVMLLAAIAGVVFTIPSLTIIAGIIIAGTSIEAAYHAIRRNS